MSAFSKLLVSGPNGQNLDYKKVIVLSSSTISVMIWTIALIQSRSRPKNGSGLEQMAFKLHTDQTKVEPMSAIFGHLKSILKPVLGPKEYSYVFGIYYPFADGGSREMKFKPISAKLS